MSHHVAVCGLVVLGGAEASQTLPEHEDAEGVTRGHQHVDTQVELVAVDDERLRIDRWMDHESEKWV